MGGSGDDIMPRPQGGGRRGGGRRRGGGGVVEREHGRTVHLLPQQHALDVRHRTQNL